MRYRRAASGLRSARLHRDHGFVFRGLARDPDEILRVAEVLDVREDQLRVRVLVPHLKEIVQAHLRLVPQGAEFREADAQRFRMVQDGDPEGAALRGERDSAGQRRRRRERRVHADVRMGVDHAHAVRADHRHVVLRANREEPRLSVRSHVTDLSEARRDYDEAFHALLPAIFDGLEGDLGGYGDHRKVHRARDFEDVRVRPDPVDARRLRIHRIDGPLELVQNEIVKDFVSDFPAVTGRADDRDG